MIFIVLDNDESQIVIVLGLGFRPQPTFHEYDVRPMIRIPSNISESQKDVKHDQIERYTKNLDDFLKHCESINVSKTVIFTRSLNEISTLDSDASTSNRFTISNLRYCTPDEKYGYNIGQPCVLIKMNKVVCFGFCCDNQKRYCEHLDS